MSGKSIFIAYPPKKRKAKKEHKKERKHEPPFFYYYIYCFDNNIVDLLTCDQRVKQIFLAYSTVNSTIK